MRSCPGDVRILAYCAFLHLIFISRQTVDIFRIRLDETDSTNRFLRDYRGEEGRVMTIVTADNQTAGRGQGRNTWESEPGRNLLFSVKTYPKGLDARRQFVMLEAGALSVRDALSAYADGFTVKWPNDIYHNDMKISGTLSECTIVHGLVGSCIMGTGININQREFISDAPNPVSLAQILGHDVSREDILDDVLERFGRYLRMVDSGEYDGVHDAYLASLYRRTGLHGYRDAAGGFMAEVETVEPDGHLVLRLGDGSVRKYMFKEVEFCKVNG